jgi:regulation of enolase protein 1 (concanavalin A-like superfamily)
MKNCLILLVFLLTISFDGKSQSTISIETLSDEFNSLSLSDQWKRLDKVEGWPDKLTTIAQKDGQLILEPGTSGWFADMNAPFVFKEVSGDFDVRARIKASGLGSEISQTLWSLGGLMARVPKRTTKEEWRPKEETWIFLTTGVAQEGGKQVIESKYTLNSKSNLKLREGKAGWINLRLVRVGHSFVLLYKYDGDKKWVVHERFYIADLPPVMQVGFNCYTNSEAVDPAVRFRNPFVFNNTVYANVGKPDMRLAIDNIQFSKPRVNFSGNDPGQSWFNNVSKNNLTDYSLSNEQVLELLGQ